MQPSAEDIHIGSDTCYTYKYTYSMYILDSRVKGQNTRCLVTLISLPFHLLLVFALIG